ACPFCSSSAAAAATAIYTLSLHDALPISRARAGARPGLRLALGPLRGGCGAGGPRGLGGSPRRGSASAGHDEAAGHPALRASPRSEEHTSELQSRENLVCRLLLEKKKHMP